MLGAGALCVTADSPSYPDRHRRLALGLAARFGFHHEIIQTDEMERPGVPRQPRRTAATTASTSSTRTCRRSRASVGIAVIVDGSNADDRGDYRPGRQAAREFGVRSPLDEVGLTKDEIRELSRAAGLPTWDEPASACLSSRIPYHSEVTDEKLRMIERAEDGAATTSGFRVCRVRHHDTIARLELGRDEMARALEPEMADDDRSRAARDRLRARHDRPARLPARQPQRRAPSADPV